MSKPNTPVLILANDSAAAHSVQQLLPALGFACVGVAVDVNQALALALSTRPAILLVEVSLPHQGSGLGALQRLRAQQAAPVVALAGFDAQALLESAGLAEPYGHVLLPCTTFELRCVLNMALYKHQADEHLQSTTRQLKALSRRVLEAQEVERRRVAIELHDELGQSLTAIKINLQLSERLKDKSPADINLENIRIVEDALRQVRLLATTLRPSMLDDLGLVPALQWMADQTAQRTGLKVDFFHERINTRLAPEIETACFRIVQEALTNVTRHAQATQVHIDLHRVHDALYLRVQDNGVGFDLAAMQERALAGSSLGVLGMQERATLMGGTLDIQSNPGEGSCLSLRCPWRTQEASP